MLQNSPGLLENSINYLLSWL